MESNTQKIALVTGGSRGLGRETALSLAAKGVDVILTYHSKQDEAEKVVATHGRKAVALRLDTGDTKTFDIFAGAVRDALTQTWGATQFNHLVNNAGVGIYAPFAETTEEQFDTLMDMHLKGVFSDTKNAPSDGGWGRDCECFQRTCPLFHAGVRRVCRDEGRGRSSNALHG